MKVQTQMTVRAITHASVAWIQLQRTTTQQLRKKRRFCIYCDAGTYVAIVEMYDLGGDGWNGASYFMDSFDGATSLTGTWDDADLYIADVATDFHCIHLAATSSLLVAVLQMTRSLSF